MIGLLHRLAPTYRLLMAVDGCWLLLWFWSCLARDTVPGESLESCWLSQVPRARLLGSPMIWQEWRAHNYIFVLRCLGMSRKRPCFSMFSSWNGMFLELCFMMFYVELDIGDFLEVGFLFLREGLDMFLVDLEVLRFINDDIIWLISKFTLMYHVGRMLWWAMYFMTLPPILWSTSPAISKACPGIHNLLGLFALGQHQRQNCWNIAVLVYVCGALVGNLLGGDWHGFLKNGFCVLPFKYIIK